MKDVQTTKWSPKSTQQLALREARAHLAELWVHLTCMDRRSKRVTRAQAAYDRVRNSLSEALDIPVFVGPDDIAAARKRLKDKADKNRDQ